MSDHREVIDVFDCDSHFKDQARALGVAFDEHAEVFYSYGWVCIIKDFLYDIKDTGAEVLTMCAEFGALEIRLAKVNEVNAFRVHKAMAAARVRSKTTCELCGDYHGKRAVLRQDVKVLCQRGCRMAVQETLEKLDQENGEKRTGTWLDDY